jgi:hypothetical protein
MSRAIALHHVVHKVSVLILLSKVLLHSVKHIRPVGSGKLPECCPNRTYVQSSPAALLEYETTAVFVTLRGLCMAPGVSKLPAVNQFHVELMIKFFSIFVLIYFNTLHSVVRARARDGITFFGFLFRLDCT